MRWAASRQSLKLQRIFLGSAGERCRPVKTRRRSFSGRLVRSARRDCKVPTEVVWGMVMGNVSPATFLTKICIVSCVSDDARDLEEETELKLLEREAILSMVGVVTS